MKSNNHIIIAKKLETKTTSNGDLIAEYNLPEIIKSYNEFTIQREDVSIEISGTEIYLIIECKRKEISSNQVTPNPLSILPVQKR